ncbi:A/G-specific adenine glycosylase [Vagococcus sp. BWB3-3]|uniref:Adenine DNA glycosylase n=1 Tax=Vagococcus allomyrinae TaxID=2794353 RepID=A0A940P5K4_9ENTE|nr:A/G-specific adenine glycosylase [Vagococcus allomyrinae]MBP1041435.1 A/G-specific adenine glycosylase [Vagococcus allomyrinae]
MKSKNELTDSRLEKLSIGWQEDKITAFQKDFLRWYDRERRLLPWRENQDPYRIWVSEIMLQQTQVVTVIPYFYRFMEWFPTIKDLAEAPEERLLKAWEGLGYYSRVRNMQVAAQQIMENFAGEMPKTITEISTLKGIGPYTAGAIASIAFDLPEPAIDGNVMRVFSRLFELDDDIVKPASRKVFDYVVRKVISHQDPSSFNQAIMDLGSGTCTPTSPKCDSCPLQSYCGAYQKGTMTNYPVKSKKVKSRPVYYLAQVIRNQEGAYLVGQRADTGLLANLWTFPLVEIASEEYADLRNQWQEYQASQEPQLRLDLVAEEAFDLSDWIVTNRQDQAVVWQKQPVGEVTHVFSHLKWHVLVTYGISKNSDYPLEAQQRWLKPTEFAEYAFPKPQQKIVELLQGLHYF